MMFRQEPEGLGEVLSLAQTFNEHSTALGLKPFEYNSSHHFYRTHVGNEKLIIRLYERLAKNIQLPLGWNFTFSWGDLCIEQGSDGERLYKWYLTNTPMDTPFNVSELFNVLRCEFKVFDCSLYALQKSHVLDTFHFEVVSCCKTAVIEKLSSYGYSVEILSRKEKSDTKYAVIFTHSSETPDLAREHLLSEGFKPRKI